MLKHVKLGVGIAAGLMTALLSTSIAEATTKIDIGKTHTVYSESSSFLWSWGTDSYGEMSRDSNHLTPYPMKYQDGTYVKNVKDVYAEEYITVVLRNDGRVFTSGANFNGQLGLGLPETNEDGTVVQKKRLTEIIGLTDIIDITHKNGRTFALRSDGKVFGFGKNANGRLGIGRVGNQMLPVSIPNLENIVDIDAGDEHALAVDTNGDVFAWGYSYYNSLGLEDTTNFGKTPAKVKNLSNVEKIFAGDNYSFAVKTDKTAWGWGINSNNEIGTGGPGVCQNQKVVITSPIQLLHSDYEPIKNVSDLKIAADRTYVNLENGETWTWDCIHPYKVEGFETIEEFDVNGQSDLMIIFRDQKLYANGNNLLGQAGNGTKETSTEAVFIDISAEEVKMQEEAKKMHGVSEWYFNYGNMFNSVFYISKALSLSPLNETMKEHMTKASKGLADKAYDAFHAYDDITSERLYKLLHETKYVPQSFKTDAQINIAYVYSGRAKWYYNRGNLYNSVYFLSKSIEYGNTNKDTTDLLNKASHELLDKTIERTNETSIDNKAKASFNLLKHSVGVPGVVKDEAWRNYPEN